MSECCFRNDAWWAYCMSWLIAVLVFLLAGGCSLNTGDDDAEREIPLRGTFRIIWLSGNNPGIESEGYWYVGDIREYTVCENRVLGRSGEVGWFVLNMRTKKIKTSWSKATFDEWLRSLEMPPDIKLTSVEEAYRREGRVKPGEDQ